MVLFVRLLVLLIIRGKYPDAIDFFFMSNKINGSLLNGSLLKGDGAFWGGKINKRNGAENINCTLTSR